MFSKPTFLVQLGWHGKNRVTHGLKQNYIDGAILSPSDYINTTLEDLAEEVDSHSKFTLFDPQFYLPDQGDRDKLNRYDYHKYFGGGDFDTSVFFNEDEREEFFEDVIDLQDDLGCDGYISPASYMESLSKSEIDDWKQLTEWFAEKVESYGRDIPVYPTIAVSGKHLAEKSMRDYLLNIATQLDVDGFYISVEFTNADSKLPIAGEEYVKSYLETFLSLKINRYKIIAGNTHQIAHLLFPMGVDAFASGHFNNLRSFDTDRWVVPDDPAPKQRVVRYYSDELLNDVRPDHLMTEIAEDTSIDITKVQRRPTSPWEDDLFDSGSINLGWPESEGSWDHYIYSCGQIAEQYQNKNKNERLDHAKRKIRKAKALHKKLKSNVNKHTDELDDAFLEDWENALEEIETTSEFNRL